MRGDPMRNFTLTIMAFIVCYGGMASAQTPEEIALPKKLTEIPKAVPTPIIDGDLGDWPLLEMGAFISDENRQGLDDCSAVIMMMWDEQNLYFAAKVYDDDLIQGKVGDQLWMEDDIQFDLDIDRMGDITNPIFNADDFQIGFSPGDFKREKPEIYGWNPRGETPMNAPENAKISSQKFKDGWTIEARIGLEDFNADLIGYAEFKEGMIFGFGRAINDYDTTGVGDGISSDGAWQDTSLMYELELTGPFDVKSQMKIISYWGKVKNL
ncbi:hypothetical protein GF312_18700 [Candidatus Poribacteria bacterium]|nr:hypothetical protein [Candidatus Poribacteria bacterium]